MVHWLPDTGGLENACWCSQQQGHSPACHLDGSKLILLRILGWTCYVPVYVFWLSSCGKTGRCSQHVCSWNSFVTQCTICFVAWINTGCPSLSAYCWLGWNQSPYFAVPCKCVCVDCHCCSSPVVNVLLMHLLVNETLVVFLQEYVAFVSLICVQIFRLDRGARLFLCTSVQASLSSLALLCSMALILWSHVLLYLGFQRDQRWLPCWQQTGHAGVYDFAHWLVCAQSHYGWNTHNLPGNILCACARTHFGSRKLLGQGRNWTYRLGFIFVQCRQLLFSFICTPSG